MNKLISFKTFFIVMLLVPSFCMFGQNGEFKEKLKDKFKAQKVAYITSELELSETESQKFWPIYNSYQAEIEQLKADIDIKPSRDMSDKEAEDMMYALLENRSKEIDVQKKYIQKMKTAISARKIAMLFKAERQFKEKVVSNMKERRMNKKGKEMK
jgi:hypothetical protein